MIALTEIVKVCVRQSVDHNLTVGARKPRPENVVHLYVFARQSETTELGHTYYDA